MNGTDRALRRQADWLAAAVLVAAAVVCGMSAHLVWSIGWLPGACLVAGMLLVWAGLRVFRDRLVIPLERMVRSMDAMRQSGQWVKLPDAYANELGILAAGFNRLIEHVEAQQRRLREQIVELQRVNSELSELAGMKDEFLQTINHQLRTPLTAISEGLQLLREPQTGQLTAEQRADLELIMENASRLKELVEEMLDLSLLKSGRRPLQRQTEDLGLVLQRACTAWRKPLGPEGLLLEAAALPPVYIDGKAIEDVLGHLLRNAIRHAPPKTPVRMQAEAQGEMVIVSVHNEGQALTPEQIKRLFQPFVHLHTPDAPGSEGSGLGLAFCRQVIERHGGAIRVESNGTAGTTVSMTLPVASPAFMFIDACRQALDEADADAAYGVCLVAPAEHAVHPAQAVTDAEALLRKNTHRGDRFVRVDERTLVIVAVTDGMGLTLMMRRLRGVLEAAKLPVRMAAAMHPADGDQPERLLDAARRRLAASQQTGKGGG